MASPAISTVVKSGHFSFDGATFTAHSHPREDPKRLKEILFPEKSWYMSQLQHYAIPFKAKDTLPQLKASLEAAVKEGKCKKVPEEVDRLENELRSSYHAGTAKATKASAAKKPAKAAAAPKTLAPSSKKVSKPKPPAKPKTTATPTPAMLNRLLANQTLSSPEKPKSAGRTKQTAWKGIVPQAIERRPRSQPPTSRSFPTTGNIYHDATGTYEIVCPEISEGWNDVDEDDLQLSISFSPRDGQPIGFLDFDVIQGAMKFSTSRAFAYSGDGDGMDWEPPSYSEATRPRLYFQWRGRDAERFEGMIHYDNKRQVGYIEFEDESCSSFTGYGGFPGLGSRMEFKGYKRHKEAYLNGEGSGRGWESYSYERYEEEERVGRWR